MKNKQYYKIELLLKTEPYQEHKIDKSLEAGRMLYNALLNKVNKRYKEMIKTKKYRNLIASLTNDEEYNKSIWEQVNLLIKEFRLTKYDIVNDIKVMRYHHNKLIYSRLAQEIAVQVYSSVHSILYGKGKEIHFKKYGQFNSLKGNDNKCGIVYKDNTVYWSGLTFKVVIPSSPKAYQYLADNLFNNLDNIKFCTIVRKNIRGIYKYYVQLTIEGVAYNHRHKLGKGKVGIDIGTSTIAIASDKVVNILELADKIQDIEKVKAKLLRKMDRSRRHNNPNKYNADGTFIKGNKDKWNNSKRYIRYQKQLRELYRKQADIRKKQHGELSNYILSLGDEFYVEQMNFQALQKRSKKTETNSKGRFKRKKRFGKSIGNRAPSMLLTMLDNKLAFHNKCLNKINTIKCKASQFNHITGDYTKKELGCRWNIINNIKVQRDIYSAFLISNVNNTLDGFDINLCNHKYDNFLELHNNKIQELQTIKQQTNKKFLSCIGI